MGRTVGELRSTLRADELASWMAFNQHSPLLEERLDLLFARLCLLVCEVSGAKKKSGGGFTLDEFLLFKPQQQPGAGSVLDFMRGRVSAQRIKKQNRDEVN